MVELTKKLNGKKYLVQASQIIDVNVDREGDVFVSSTGFEDGVMVTESYEQVKTLIAAATTIIKDGKPDFIERFCIANHTFYMDANHGNSDNAIYVSIEHANKCYDQIHNIQS